MLEELERAVEELDVPIDSASLRQGFRLLDRLAATLTMAAAAFDAAQLWELDGATSLTAWLRAEGRMAARDASRTARTGKRLRRCSVTVDVWTSGALSGGQVAAVVANVSARTAALYAEQEGDLVPALAPLTVEDTATAMRTWQARAESALDGPEPPEPEQSLHLSRLLDGRGALDGDLDAETTDLLGTALRIAQTPDGDGEPARTPARRRADAQADVALFFLDHHGSTSVGSRHRPHVNVVVDLDRRIAGDPAAGHAADGFTLTPETIARLLCDCGVHRVVTRGRSTILDDGRTTRTVPAPLFNAVVLRDEHCRWPGCDRPPSWCEAHHLRHWERGGATELSNLALLCSRHHHLAHKPGWHPELLPDGTFEVTTTVGTVRASRPPPRC